jgi:hypothetical protein
MWTKRQLVGSAYEEIGLANYEFELTPEEWQSALRRMDSMIASWQAKNIYLGYALPASPDDSDLDDDAQIQDTDAEAIFTNLAKRLAPSFGKTVQPDTMTVAKDTYNALLCRAAMPAQMQFPRNTPAGAGNKYWVLTRNPFLRGPDESKVVQEENGNLGFLEGK